MTDEFLYEDESGASVFSRSSPCLDHLVKTGRLALYEIIDTVYGSGGVTRKITLKLPEGGFVNDDITIEVKGWDDKVPGFDWGSGL